MSGCQCDAHRLCWTGKTGHARCVGGKHHRDVFSIGAVGKIFSVADELGKLSLHSEFVYRGCDKSVKIAGLDVFKGSAESSGGYARCFGVGDVANRRRDA